MILAAGQFQCGGRQAFQRDGILQASLLRHIASDHIGNRRVIAFFIFCRQNLQLQFQSIVNLQRHRAVRAVRVGHSHTAMIHKNLVAGLRGLQGQFTTIRCRPGVMVTIFVTFRQFDLDRCDASQFLGIFRTAAPGEPELVRGFFLAGIGQLQEHRLDIRADGPLDQAAFIALAVGFVHGQSHIRRVQNQNRIRHAVDLVVNGFLFLQADGIDGLRVSAQNFHIGVVLSAGGRCGKGFCFLRHVIIVILTAGALILTAGCAASAAAGFRFLRFGRFRRNFCCFRRCVCRRVRGQFGCLSFCHFCCGLGLHRFLRCGRFLAGASAQQQRHQDRHNSDTGAKGDLQFLICHSNPPFCHN